MKRINNFSKHNLLVESLVYFDSDFRQMLADIRDASSEDSDWEVSNLAMDLINICGKDADLTQNYAGVVDGGLVKYVMDSRVNYDDVEVNFDWVIDIKYITDYISQSKSEELLGYDYANIEEAEKYKNSFKLIKTITGSDHYILLLQSNETKKYILLYKLIESPSQRPFIPKLPKNFSEVRLGRFINKIFSEFGYDKYNNSTIEKFVNYYKSLFTFNRDAHKNFHIISGQDIKYYYNIESYENNKGQLGASCMRRKDSQSYFKIYTENPDVCKMLILTGNKKDSGKLGKKIIGRALLWTLMDGSLYMDRIYTSSDSMIKLFEKWAKDNNYTTYNYQQPKLLCVKVKAKDYGEYPYMDTFEYYLPKKGVLVNIANFTELLSIPDINSDSFGRKALRFIKSFGSKSKENPEVLRLKSTLGRGDDTGWILDAKSSLGWIRPD